MQTVILAGGYGTQLVKNSSKPKPMVKLEK